MTAIDRTVCILHWGQTGAGPKLLFELADSWNHSYPSEICVSYNQDAELASEFRIDVPILPVHTYRRSRLGFVMGLVRLPVLSWRFRTFLQKNNVDTVISVMSNPYQSFVLPITHTSRICYMYCLHDAIRHKGERSRILTLLSDHSLRQSDWIITFSSSVRNQLLAESSIDPRKVVATVHPAWATDEKYEQKRRTLTRESTVSLGFFGRLFEYKGLRLLMDAVRIVNRQGYSVNLNVYGEGPDAYLENQATDIPGLWHTTWIPESQIVGIIESFDIVALPYIEASQSGVLAQAMALGIPVVATPVGGLREQVMETRSGVLASEISAEALADAIKLLIDNPEIYQNASHAALEAAKGDYGWGRVVSDLREVVLSNRRS